MEDFFERKQIIIRTGVAELLKEGRHLGLPARVDGVVLHAGSGAGEIVGFKVADQEAVGAEEERVVAPAGGAQGVEHLWPHAGVAGFVFFEFFLADFEQEADAHGGYLHLRSEDSRCGLDFFRAFPRLRQRTAKGWSTEDLWSGWRRVVGVRAFPG